jgi:hypothetical protein
MGGISLVFMIEFAFNRLLLKFLNFYCKLCAFFDFY